MITGRRAEQADHQVAEPEPPQIARRGVLQKIDVTIE
jgi:hypothetical protein